MESGLLSLHTHGAACVANAWDLRADAARTGSERLKELEDDSLMFLLLDAIYPKDVDELFSELYLRYSARVRSWCRRYIRDPQRAEDMMQEVFMRAFRYRSSFRGDSRTSTWLFTVTRNYCLTEIRKSNADPATGAALLDPRLRGDSGLETHRRMERDETFRNTWRLIHAALTPLEARVMVLHYGQGLPLSLIGSQLGLTNPSGAKACIVNGKRKLGLILARRGFKTKSRASTQNSGAFAARASV